jgi:hypothetical protein
MKNTYVHATKVYNNHHKSDHISGPIGTIAVRRSISLSMEGFKRSRSIRIQVLSDALALEGIPTGVTRVANRCALKYHLYFLHV